MRLKESTRNVFRRHGWRIDRAVHNYLYFVFYSAYVKAALLLTGIVIKLFSRFEQTNYLTRFIFDRYHAKVLSREDVRKIVTLDEDIELGRDTSIVPFKHANSIILKEPNHLAVMECPCKLTLEEPCQPVASCIAIGQPIVDFWLDHCGRYNARRITPEEAMEIIDSLRRTGHINQAFFKVATGGGMGVLCNCCPNCCVSLRATALARRVKGGGGVSMYAPSGYTVGHDPGKCVLCGACAEACHFSAIRLTGDHRGYDGGACLGCGLCVEACEHGALELAFSGGPLLPLDMDMIRNRLR